MGNNIMQPNYLYKYRTLDEYSEKILLNNEIYIPSPLEFNDPFDCKFNYDINTSVKYLRKQLREQYPSFSNEQLNEAVEWQISLETHKDPTQWKEVKTQSMNNLLNRVGVYCLSETNDNILMWSHYSNGHKGFCLEFNLNSYLSRAMKVKYQKKYPALEFTGNEDQDKIFFDALLFTKSDFWCYEKEWRVIEPMGSGAYQIGDDDLNGIIMGCQISDQHRTRIMYMIEKRKNKPKLYQARVKHSEFGLDIVEI